MKEIIVTTQKELDGAIKEKDAYIIIRDTKEWLSVSENATIKYVSGNATIQSVSGNATIQYVYDNATIKSVSENATIKYVYGNATIQYVYDNATIKYVSGNATIQYVYDNATIQYVYDNATIQSVSENATIKYVSGNATIQSVSGNATIQSVSDNATIKIYSPYVILHGCFMCAVIIMIGCVCKIKKKQKTVSIVKTKKVEEHTKQDFLNIYGIDEHGKVTLYKSVNPKNNTDFYTGKIKYEGTVSCPDWDGDKNIQCGKGLHLSPLPHQALSYNEGKLLECKVDKKDFVVYPYDITKVRCKKVTVVGEYK